MAVRIVSWRQSMRDNLMLKTNSVTQLVNAGVIRVRPACDPDTGTIACSTLRAQGVIAPEQPNWHTRTSGNDRPRRTRANEGIADA